MSFIIYNTVKREEQLSKENTRKSDPEMNPEKLTIHVECATYIENYMTSRVRYKSSAVLL